MRARPEVSAKIHSGLQRRDLFGAAVEELRLAAHREQRAIDHSLAPLVPAWDGPPSTLASPRADFRRLCTWKGAPAADALPLFTPGSATRRDMGRSKCLAQIRDQAQLTSVIHVTAQSM